MKDKEKNPDIREREKEVKKDHPETKKSIKGVDNETLAQELDILNPDPNSLDRG